MTAEEANQEDLRADAESPIEIATVVTNQLTSLPCLNGGPGTDVNQLFNISACLGWNVLELSKKTPEQTINLSGLSGLFVIAHIFSSNFSLLVLYPSFAHVWLSFKNGAAGRAYAYHDCICNACLRISVEFNENSKRPGIW